MVEETSTVTATVTTVTAITNTTVTVTTTSITTITTTTTTTTTMRFGLTNHLLFLLPEDSAMLLKYVAVGT